jgi:hypothetical protein
MNTGAYHCIGKGFCGSIWALDGESDAATVIKREDGGPGRSVTNDYNMHLRVLESALEHPASTPFSIPQCHALMQPADPWWQQHLPQFPAGYSECRALVSERIPKAPRGISDKIAPISGFVKQNPADDACLIRPYLGRRRRYHQELESKSRFRRFSLRNVPLHIDQMEALSLDTTAYAEAMAEALAMMHWGARIDANDIEFVLAPPRGASPVFRSDYLGVHSLWVLDFDCCQPLSMDEAGVERACAAFFKNDPFYPRPGGGEATDEELWRVFKRKFLVASRAILKENEVLLAEKLIARIEEEGKMRMSRKEELARAEDLPWA